MTVMRDTNAGEHVPCEDCGKPLKLMRAVAKSEHALSIWTCDDCMERVSPGWKAAMAAGPESLRKYHLDEKP